MRPERLTRAGAVVLPPTMLVVLIVGLWAWLSAHGFIANYLLPAPLVLLKALCTSASVLLRHGTATTMEALGGFALGSFAGVVAAILLASSRWLRQCFFPLALASQAVPIAAITPLIVLLIGRGLPAILTVVSIAAFFPMLINMTRGLREADIGYHELLHSLSATSPQRLRMVELPAALPYLFAALKVSASASFITAIVGEWIGSNVGLGYLIVISGQYFKIPTLWAAVVVTAALTLILVGLVTLAERLAMPWLAAETTS
ncbi:ABC transporter permease [Acidisoma cladoniae]|uniref:ABC transporter permease n=1 Tax=Acidisoma cladoniae TaxID=3040935 RepID=UPI00254DDC60|nr:ABC transporter permease [Acidisoma sp. PAMC 29798]